jgi:hypothetical protein
MTTSFSRLIAVPAFLMASLLFVPAVAASVSEALGADQGDAAGAIALRAEELHGLTLQSEGMMPGDSVTGAVELRNDGDGELRYSVTTSTSDGANDLAALSTVLAVTVRTADAGAGDDDPCDDRSGLVVREGAPLDGAGRLVGDATPGDDRGDRTLAGGAGETLCFTVELPLTAGNEFQGTSSTVSFGFTSEATANNP